MALTEPPDPPDAENHPVFTPPPNPETRIWRYLDFTKFVDLLERHSLFFARADSMDDPFEGSYGYPNRDERLRRMLEAMPVMTVPPEQWLQNAAGSTLAARRMVYLNCWHMNELESMAMWKLYTRTNESVAIRSTYQRLRSCLPRKEIAGQPVVFIGMVKYVDYDTTAIPIGNTFDPFVHKRRSFEHERELRAVVANMARGPAPPSMSFELDPASLIDTVYIAPTSPAWFRDLTAKVLERYGLGHLTPQQSSLDASPFF